MTEQTVVLIGKQGVAFDDKVAAALYLSQLGIDDELEPVSVITPPPMSELLKKAFAFLRDNRDGNASEFLDAIAGTPEEGVSEATAEEVLGEAHKLLDVLIPDRTRLTNEQLALQIYQECGGNRIAAIQALRAERLLGLKEAKEIIYKAAGLN